MKIVSSLKTLASNIRFLCTVDMQKQHKLLKQIERTQLRQEDDIECLGHRLEDLPEQIDLAVSQAMDRYDMSQDIEDAINDYDFESIIEDGIRDCDLSDAVNNVLETCDLSDYFDLDHWLNYESGITDMIRTEFEEFDIDNHVDWSEKISEHVDPSSMADDIAEIIDEMFDGSSKLELKFNKQIAECMTRQELSKRFAELSSKMFFSSESFSEVADAEQVVEEFDMTKEIEQDLDNEVLSDPILEILEAAKEKQSN